MNTILRFLLLLPLAAFGQSTTPLKSLGTISDLTNRFPVPGEYIQVQGYRTISDWGAGRTMHHNPTSTNAVDNGCTFATVTGDGRWEALDCESGRVNLRHFGAWGNGASNDISYIRAAASKLQVMGGGIFEAPPGTYMIRSAIRGDLVCYFSNLTSVAFHMDGAMFTSDDFADDEWNTANLVNVGSAATATTATPHGFAPGDAFVVKDAVDNGYNGQFTVISTSGPTQLSFTLSGYETPPGFGAGKVHLTDASRVLFSFKNCRNVNMGRVKFGGTILPRYAQYQVGWSVTQFLDDCKTIRGEICASGIVAGWWSGLYDLDRGRCEDFDVTFSGYSAGYPVRLYNSGHRSKFRVYANDLHRGAYVGGVEDSDFDIYLRDYDVTGILVTTQPIGGAALRGSKNINVLVDDIGTTEDIALPAVGGTRYMATIAGYDINVPVTNSNIRVTVRGRNMPDTSIMQTLTYRTNHWIDGLHLSGTIDQSGVAAADVRHDFYIDQEAANHGQYRGVEIENLIVIPATNVGAYTATLRIRNAVDNPRVNNYRGGMPFNYRFPAGREIDVVPVFPGFEYVTSEQMQMQQLAGGLVLNYSAVSHTLPYSVSSNELTVQWVGKVPASGDLGLFSVGPHPDYATNNSLGLSVRSGSLVARLYGATKADYRQLEVADWQSAHGGLISEVSLVRTNGGLAIFVDGHRQATTETTTNSAPDWSGEILGSYAVVGTEDESLGYAGAVYRMAIWDYDRQEDFPSLATAWTSGQSAQGSVADTIGLATLNGGFETAGGGGGDVFADWVEGVSGASTITQTNDSQSGSYSAAFNVDGSNSFASLTVNPPMTIGSTYRVSLWAKSAAGDGGAVSVVGPIDGESIIYLTNGWQHFILTKVWGGTTLSVKRADGANKTLLVDSVEVRRTGSVLDMDWTIAGADILTGRRPTFSAETVTRVVPRTAGISADRGDANVTLYPGQDAPIQLFGTALSVGRTVSFYDAMARIGDGFRILRTGGGAYTLTAAGRTVAADQWLDVAFNGTSWVPTGYGYVTNTYVTPPTNTLIAPLILKVGTNTDPAIFILASNLPASLAYHGRYGADGIEAGVGTNARASKILATDIPAGGWTVWSNLTLKGDIVRSNGLTLTGSLDSKAVTNHTHDASNTVSGQFESARLGGGTSTTNTFLRGGEPPTWDQLSVDDIPNLPTSKITSGTFEAERLGTGTATTNTFLQGNGTNAPFWGTVPSTPSPTNGIADAPSDGIFYGRRNNAWTQPDVSDLSGVSGFGLSWIDGTVADSTDALDALDLIGAGVATIDSPATYAVRVGSGGTISTRHRLNLIASGGLSLSISDDAGNDESDVTVSVADAGITYAKIEDVTASRILGRGAGGGDGVVQELELGTGLSFSGTTINVDFPTTSNSTVLGNTDAVTVPDTESAETTLIGTIRSGESATFGAGTLSTGSIIKVEAMGTITAAGNWADGVLRVKFGSSRTLAFTVLEPDSYTATDYTWRLTAWLSVTTAGVSATTVLSGLLEYEYPNDADTPGVRRLRHLSGTASGTLDTTGSNAFDVTWDNATGLEVDWTCNHLLVTRY